MIFSERSLDLMLVYSLILRLNWIRKSFEPFIGCEIRSSPLFQVPPGDAESKIGGCFKKQQMEVEKFR
jgi:hypothetical protein